MEFAGILESMGVVFKWACADIITKSQLIEKTAEISFEKILEMDTKNKQLFPNDTNKKESRTRALNRMTHMLQLSCGIMDGVLESDAPLSEIVSETYTRTISRIHKWVIQKMVRAGIYVVPSREDFLKTLNCDLSNPEQKIRNTDTLKNISKFASHMEKKFDDAKIKWIAWNIL